MIQRWMLGSALLGLSGCYLNQAIVNPYAYAPLKPYTYIFPEGTKIEERKLEGPAIPNSENPLSLAEVVDIALSNTPETATSWANARAAAANYGISQAPFLPQIDGVGPATRALTPGVTLNAKGEPTVVRTYSTNVHPQLQLTYTILDFGQRLYTSEIALQALESANWTHNRVIQTVVQTLTNDYYNYLFQLKLKDSIIANIETAQTTLNFALAEKLSGTKDIADVLQAKTLLLQAQLNLAAQKKLVQEAYSTLLADMGVPANVVLKFIDLPQETSTDVIMKDVDKLITDALVMRPDLRAQEANLKSAEASLSLAYSDMYPTLNYQLNWGRTYFENWLHGKNDWTSVISLDIPLFQGFSQMNTVKEAKANIKAALAAVKATELQIARQITTSHTDVQASAETLEYAKSFLDSAGDQYDVALRRYRFGLGTILDVVSAQDSLATARTRVAQSVQQWYVSLANLTYAVGYYTFNPEESR